MTISNYDAGILTVCLRFSENNCIYQRNKAMLVCFSSWLSHHYWRWGPDCISLSHIVTSTRTKRRWSLKYCLLEMMKLVRPNILHLLVMTKEIVASTHHTVVSMRGVYTCASALLIGPRHRSIVSANGWSHREGIGRYLLAYMEALIVRKVFQRFDVSLQTQRNTHEDIDELFILTLERLWSSHAIKVLGAHSEVNQTYGGGKAKVMQLELTVTRFRLLKVQKLCVLCALFWTLVTSFHVSPYKQIAAVESVAWLPSSSERYMIGRTSCTTYRDLNETGSCGTLLIFIKPACLILRA